MWHEAPQPCPEEWLAETLRPLPPGSRILLEAGPGWGKTTLAAYWYGSAAGRRAWLTLRPLDVHPHVLIRRLADVMARLTGRDELAAPAGGWSAPVTEHLLAGWLLALQQADDPGLLVIDQAHLLLDTAAQPLLRLVMQAFGARLKVVLCGRQPLVPLLAPDWGDVPTQLGAAQLALTVDQVLALAARCGQPCSRLAAEALRDSCGGWPGACQLLLRQVRSRRVTASRLLSNDQLIPLLEEWLAELSPAECRLLQAASVCEQVDWPRLQRLCGASVGRLHWLSALQQRLLVEAGSVGAGQWTLLPFLREPMLTYWQRRDPAGIRTLKQRRVQDLLDDGDIAAAIDTVLQDGDPAFVTTLLIRHGWEWVVRGMWVELGELLAVPGGDAVRAEPQLALLRAWWLLEYRRDSGACARWLDEVVARSPPEEQTPEWQYRHRILLAHIHYYFDDLKAARLMAREFLQIPLPPAENLLASRVQALTQLHLGALEAARVGLEAVIPQAHALGAAPLGLEARLRLGQLALLQGEPWAAAQALQRTHEFAREQRLTADRSMDSVWRGRAELCLLAGEFDAAEPFIAAGAELMAPLGDYWQLPYRALGLPGRLEALQLTEFKQAALVLLEQLEQHFYARQWQYRIRLVLIYAANVLRQCGADPQPLLLRLRRQTCWYPNPASVHELQDNLVSAWVRLALADYLDEAAPAVNMNFQLGRGASGLRQRLEWVAWLHRHGRNPAMSLPRALLAQWLESGFLWDLLLSAPWLEGQWPGWTTDIRIATSATAVGNLQRLQELAQRRPRLPEVEKAEPPAGLELTEREWQVLGLIGAGLSNEQIAAQLFVALSTVKTHINRIYAKLGVSERKQARQLWRQWYYR